MTPADIELIMDQIEAQRASNNKWFMKAWRLLFQLAPVQAAEIQLEIRNGDMKISELNGQLVAGIGEDHIEEVLSNSYRGAD